LMGKTSWMAAGDIASELESRGKQTGVFGYLWDTASDAQRYAALSLRPAWTILNLVGSTILHGMSEGPIKMIQDLPYAVKIFKNPEMVKRMTRSGMLPDEVAIGLFTQADRMRRHPGAALMKNELVQAVEGARDVLATSSNPALRAIRWFGAANTELNRRLESVLRTTHFKNALEKQAVTEFGQSFKFEQFLKAVEDGIEVQRAIADQGLKVAPEVLEKIEAHFPPEWLNRFTGVIVFTPLSEKEVEAGGKMKLNRLSHELLKQELEISFNEAVIKQLSREGFSTKWGGRQIDRIIQERVANVIAEKILKGEIAAGLAFTYGS